MAKDPLAAYIHIPFCRRRCFYCDFPISVLGNQRRGETSMTVETYIDLLGEEIAVTPVGTRPLRTVFFGGGTPSLLSVAQLEQVLGRLERQFGLAPDVEISMEMDPGTFSLEHLQGYLGAGLNRISLGVQALDDGVLERCGRYHRVADVTQSVEWLHRLGMSNWSLDLISGLPGQTLADWQTGLTKAVEFQPHHLSIYDLTLEPQTVFARRYQLGEAPLPTDNQTADMYRFAQSYLISQGYDHYELSNYAQPGHRCRHNLTYWRNQAYYGFGMGATSYTQHQRVSRPCTLATYAQWVREFQMAAGQHSIPPTAVQEQLLDRLIVGLRLREGITGEELRALCDSHTWNRLCHSLQPHIQEGWVVVVGHSIANAASNLAQPPSLANLERLRLSDPEGFLFSNRVLVDCFRLFPDLVAA